MLLGNSLILSGLALNECSVGQSSHQARNNYPFLLQQDFFEHSGQYPINYMLFLPG